MDDLMNRGKSLWRAETLVLSGMREGCWIEEHGADNDGRFSTLVEERRKSGIQAEIITKTWCSVVRFGWRAWYVRRGGTLVESMPFVRRVMGSTPALAATKGPWASPSLTVAFGASAWNSGTVSVLYLERLWVVEDLMRRYTNSLNEWMRLLLNA